MLRIKLLILCLTVVCFQLMFVQQPAAEGPKSKSTAWQSSLAFTVLPAVAGIALLSDGGSHSPARTAAGVGIGSLGILCGPGVGHLYAKNGDVFAKGVIIRGAAGAVIVYSMSKFEIDIWGNGDNDNSLPTLGILLGAATLVGSAINDIRTSANSVEQYNQRHGFSQIKLQPYYFANHEAPGLLLSARF
jgi:hypothetical protein